MKQKIIIKRQPRRGRCIASSVQERQLRGERWEIVSLFPAHNRAVGPSGPEDRTHEIDCLTTAFHTTRDRTECLYSVFNICGPGHT